MKTILIAILSGAAIAWTAAFIYFQIKGIPFFSHRPQPPYLPPTTHRVEDVPALVRKEKAP